MGRRRHVQRNAQQEAAVRDEPRRPVMGRFVRYTIMLALLPGVFAALFFGPRSEGGEE